jgi:hypothetical protein
MLFCLTMLNILRSPLFSRGDSRLGLAVGAVVTVGVRCVFVSPSVGVDLLSLRHTSLLFLLSLELVVSL